MTWVEMKFWSVGGANVGAVLEEVRQQLPHKIERRTYVTSISFPETCIRPGQQWL